MDSTNSISTINNNYLETWKPIINSLITSPTSGVRNEGDATLILLKAYELGIGFGNAIPHIHIINGKTGIDIHIIKAILHKPGSGIRTKKTKDFQPIYQCVTYDKKVLRSDMLPDNSVRLSKLSGNEELIKLELSKGNIPYVIYMDNNGNPAIVDYITEYVFTRKKKDIDGSYITETITSSFSLDEAKRAGLIYDKDGNENPLSVWYKYRKTMIDHRAYTNGARDIASDLLMGNYSYDELLNMNGYTPTEMTEDGTITEIRDKNGNVIKPKNVENT